MKKLLFILTLALVALAGCKKDPAPGTEPEQGLTPDTPTTIVFKTSKAVGETVTLGFRRSEMQDISMDGAKAESALPAGDWGIFTCKLSSQTVTIKGDITLFDCKNSGITEIALTKDLKLFDFNCSNNELTSLDVSGLTELELFACSSNKLTSLNIEGCENLYYLECYSNSIKDEAMTDVVNDLPTLGAPGVGRFVVTAEGCGNVITEDDIDIAVDKNWDVMDDKFHSISQRTTFTSPANCYIVTKASRYTFKAVKGNSSESVGSVASAEVLWETFGTHKAPEVGDLVKDVSYNNGEITFKATDRKGNAVIAAKDAAGNILWSWHIWMTDQPVEKVYPSTVTMMDRNLGAISASSGNVGTIGLKYQWGRKDPFLGAASHNFNVEAKSTITWPSSEQSSATTGTILYATEHPTTFIDKSAEHTNEDWYYTGNKSTDNTRWTTSDKAKSIYDPCPAGWRVPDDYKDVLNADLNETLALYPLGDYWTASPDPDSYNAIYLEVSTKSVSTYSQSRYMGLKVRCIKE